MGRKSRKRHGVGYLIYKASLNGSFMKDFMTLNIINFADMTRREKDRVSWDVRRVSSP